MGGSGSSPRAPRDLFPLVAPGSSPRAPARDLFPLVAPGSSPRARVTLSPLVAQGAVLGSAHQPPRPEDRSRSRVTHADPAVGTHSPCASRACSSGACASRACSSGACASRACNSAACARRALRPPHSPLPCRVPVPCASCAVCLPRPALCRPRTRPTSSSRPPSLPAPAPLAPVSVPHAPSPAHRASQAPPASHPSRSSGRLVRTTSTVIASIMVRR